MKKYEIMYILKALDEESLKAANEKVQGVLTNNGATIVKVDEWGLREFAYPIDDEVKGYYYVMEVEAEEFALNEFTRKGRHNPDLLRNLITVK